MRITLDTTASIQMLDITREVERALVELHATDGVAHVYCRHTTAGLTINENADPDVPRDMLLAFSRIVPDKLDYKHAEGNSPAHIGASLVGCSALAPVRSGRLQFGRWQGIFFCEFDGPRLGRSVEVTFMPGIG